MKENSFDFLRLLFAVFVVITHSYPLAGVKEGDVLSVLTHNQAALSHIGVNGFFIISGYMIYRSIILSKSIWQYFFKRFIRIYPAYIVLIFLTVILIAPIASDITYFEFIRHPLTTTYVIKNLNFFSPVIFRLPFVFENNPYPNAVNGSLWTIPYEFLFYILIAIILLIPRVGRGYILCVFFMILFVTYLNLDSYSLGVIPTTSFEYLYLLRFGLMFLAGAIVSELKLIEKNTLYIAMISVVFLIGVFQFKLYDYAQFLILPPLILSIGFMKIPIIYRINRLGDFSYGIYLYSFLVQQFMQHLFVFKPIPLMIFSSIVSFLLAFCSWHLVEKRALKLKDMFVDNGKI